MTDRSEEPPTPPPSPEKPNRLLEWNPIGFAQSGLMYWVNSRVLWPLGIQLNVDVETSRMYVEAFEHWIVLGFQGTTMEEIARQRMVMAWIADRVGPSEDPGDEEEEPAREPEPEPEADHPVVH